MTRTSVVVPVGWTCERCADTGADLLTALELPESGFRPRANLASRPSALALHDWIEEQVRELRTCLTDADVAEAEVRDLGQHEAGYVRVMHRWESRHLITEVWAWRPAETTWTLTATVDLRDYADYDEVFDLLAASFRA